MQGRFVWHELWTTDVAVATEFYTQLLGWSYSEHAMGEGETYKMMKLGGNEFGGFVQINPERPGPTRWFGYVSTDDIDAAAERAQAAGGQVPMPPTDIHNVGRFAMLSDPAGANFFLYMSANPSSDEPAAPSSGTFCWAELTTPEVDKVTPFYGEVLGWQLRVSDIGDRPYTIFSIDDKDAAAVMSPPPGAEEETNWLYYLMVDDVDTSTAKVEELGGHVYLPPTDIPNIGRFSIVADSLGATFGLFAA